MVWVWTLGPRIIPEKEEIVAGGGVSDGEASGNSGLPMRVLPFRQNWGDISPPQETS